MLRRLAAFTIIFLLSSPYLFAQPLSAYVDIQNQVMVWDNGLIHKVDYLAPQSMKIGRIAIPYVDNSSSFKVYYKGGVKTITQGLVNGYDVSDCLVSYLISKALYVFDRGNTKLLAGLCTTFSLADSLVMFLDDRSNEYKVYYNGQTYVIESFIPDSVLSAIKVTDNIVAYKNYANQFRIFYHGNIIPQEDYYVRSFDAGRNTVAYVDPNRQFKIFHNGQTFLAEDYPPQSFFAGDDLVAYVSNDGYFKIFYGDSIRTVGFFNPTYQVGDNIVAYKDPSGYLKAFYKGNITELESYYPNNLTIQYNSLAYIDATNTLKLFSDGETYEVTNASLDNWQLNYDVIKYQIGQNMFKVFYKGQEY
ncbi:MAG TPA: hypothetical protein VN721_03965 [Flavipsychrobacter sp.]|nr:hypothetical protein [Flavipsychrobacter sp.]